MPAHNSSGGVFIRNKNFLLVGKIITYNYFTLKITRKEILMKH